VKRDFLERLGERVVVFDGAMGTGSMSSACS
jgi:methionine synthase I (cobalamin-dependent)